MRYLYELEQELEKEIRELKECLNCCKEFSEKKSSHKKFCSDVCRALYHKKKKKLKAHMDEWLDHEIKKIKDDKENEL